MWTNRDDYIKQNNNGRLINAEFPPSLETLRIIIATIGGYLLGLRTYQLPRFPTRIFLPATKFAKQIPHKVGGGPFRPHISESQQNYIINSYKANIKIIQCDTKRNNPTTTYSNTKKIRHTTLTQKSIGVLIIFIIFATTNYARALTSSPKKLLMPIFGTTDKLVASRMTNPTYIL